MRTGLTKQEKTTDIWFDEKDPLIHIRTHNTALKKRLAAYGRVRSAEGLSAQRESRLLPPLTDIGGFAATRGCTPCAAYAAIPAHPQKQYTRLWRLYHFCGFSFYPGGDTHSHLSL